MQSESVPVVFGIEVSLGTRATQASSFCVSSLVNSTYELAKFLGSMLPTQYRSSPASRRVKPPAANKVAAILPLSRVECVCVAA